jgi:hypothetical protein
MDTDRTPTGERIIVRKGTIWIAYGRGQTSVPGNRGNGLWRRLSTSDITGCNQIVTTFLPIDVQRVDWLKCEFQFPLVRFWRKTPRSLWTLNAGGINSTVCHLPAAVSTYQQSK